MPPAMKNAVIPLHGLRVSIADSPDAECGEYDVRWRRKRVDRLAPCERSGQVTWELRDGVSWSAHHYTDLSETTSRFLISPDGRSVESESIASIGEDQLWGLFAEPVMRNILHRRSLISLHAAALCRHGSAILIAGERGRGKSTLSCALRQAGWELMADDLVRLVDRGGVWRAAYGVAAAKLNPDSAVALGYPPETLRVRWEGHPLSADNKLLLRTGVSDSPIEGVPIRALFLLEARDSAADALAWREVQGVEAVRGLMPHLTPDPAAPGNAPTREAARVVGGLLRQAKTHLLTLPDRLEALAGAAAALDACLDPATGEIP